MNYTNEELQASAGYISTTAQEIAEVYRYVADVLIKAKADYELINVVAEPMDDFLSFRMESARSYRSVHYMRKFAAEIMRICVLHEADALPSSRRCWHLITMLTNLITMHLKQNY
ncbi:hypothetical protein ACFQ21_02530 [Ohtaekwangia kribbensis]|uniref:Uncharacterized protein n=1 Tax=Ohtaekwangia kribbensis TaxID=688913 RepID=A0ABW3JYS0_9BACT